MVDVEERLLLEDVDGRHAGPAGAQRLHQRARAMRPARDVFTRSAVGCIRPRSAAVTMPSVAGTSRMWSETTSHSAKNASRLAAVVHPSALARSRDAGRAHTRTSVPNARP